MRKNLPIEEIIKKYEEGMLQRQLAKEYGVGNTTIARRLEEYYQKTGKEKPKRKKTQKIGKEKPKRERIQKIELLIEEIIKKYEEGISEEQLAKEYGVGRANIHERIKETYKNRGEKMPRRLRSATLIVDFLNKGLTIEEIIETASKKNIIIPQDIINVALAKVNSKNLTHDNEER